MSPDDAMLERDCHVVDSCKDSFRYKLVNENGRYRFESVHFIGGDGCDNAHLTSLVSLIEGKWLDELDLDATRMQECRQGRAAGGPDEVARIITEVKALLPDSDDR